MEATVPEEVEEIDEEETEEQDSLPVDKKEELDEESKVQLQISEHQKMEEDVARFEKMEDVDQFKTFKIRPDIEQRFQTAYVKEEIHAILYSTLKGKKYSEENPAELSKNLANTIRSRIRDSGKIYPRYKVVVNIILGENKGAGVKSGARCLWDPECDTCVTVNFLNDSIFCVATVFGILFY